MQPPFNVEQFFGIFARYNDSIWPFQILLLGIGFLAVFLVVRRPRVAGRALPAILAFLWGWMALVFHFAHFSRISSGAWLFGALFLLQALLFARLGFWHRLEFAESPSRWRAAVGWVFLLYGLAIYPFLSYLFGHAYMRSPTFGVPCPTTIFTIGVLYFARPPLPRHLLVVPIFWAAVGGSAAFLLDVYQDLGLLVAGLGAVWLLHRRQEEESDERRTPHSDIAA
jgi:hypothetical protein